jgi:hypothetical protein
LDATCVHDQHGFVVTQGIQELIVALNERLLLFFVALARDHVGLVVFETQAMRQRDQSRAAFIYLSYTRPNSCLIQAPIWRVERGSAALAHAFKLSSCLAVG